MRNATPSIAKEYGKQSPDKTPIVEVSKKHGVTEQTIYAWKKCFGGMNIDEAKRPSDVPPKFRTS